MLITCILDDKNTFILTKGCLFILRRLNSYFFNHSRSPYFFNHSLSVTAIFFQLQILLDPFSLQMCGPVQTKNKKTKTERERVWSCSSSLYKEEKLRTG